MANETKVFKFIGNTKQLIDAGFSEWRYGETLFHTITVPHTPRHRFVIAIYIDPEGSLAEIFGIVYRLAGMTEFSWSEFLKKMEFGDKQLNELYQGNKEWCERLLDKLLSDGILEKVTANGQ